MQRRTLQVTIEGEPAPRTLDDVLTLIRDHLYPPQTKRKAAAIFTRLAEAGGAVHGETVETVHLHDVGAVDAIVDVMGTVAALRLLGVEARLRLAAAAR